MVGILQYLMQQMLPPDFVASPIFHVRIEKGITDLIHTQETARYILIHGVSFTTAVGGAAGVGIKINNVPYMLYTPSPNMSGTHMVPHVFEGGTCRIVVDDPKLDGTIHYQFIKTKV